MSLQCTLNPSNGSFLALDSKNGRTHCVLRRPVDAMRHCLCKFLLGNSGSYNQNSVSFSRRVGYNSKICMSRVNFCRNELRVCYRSHVHQKEFDGLVLERTSLGLSSIMYEEDEEKLESSEMLGHAEKDEDIHMLMAIDNFNWEPKSYNTIDLNAKPVSDIMGSKSDESRAVHAMDGYQGSSGGKIHKCIFHGDGIDLGKHYEKMIGEDPRNPMLLRNYGHYLHQFKGNLVGAENCYLPAQLLDPENGQYLVEYAMIAWELHQSEWITEYFLERAIKSSPDDPFVNAAYARFLYQIDDDED